MRQNEDWSGLADLYRSESGDLFDPIKYVALSDDGSIWISFGGQARVRFESWRDFGFGASNDDNFWIGRMRFHGDLHVGSTYGSFWRARAP